MRINIDRRALAMLLHKSGML